MMADTITHNREEKKEILRVLTQYIKNVVTDDKQQIEIKISTSPDKDQPEDENQENLNSVESIETIIVLKITPTS